MPVRLPFAPLSDVQELDPSHFDIGDAREAVGELPDALDLFPMIEDRCESQNNPTGQHIYGGPRAERCMFCGEPSRLDD